MNRKRRWFICRSDQQRKQRKHTEGDAQGAPKHQDAQDQDAQDQDAQGQEPQGDAQGELPDHLFAEEHAFLYL